MNIEMTMTYGNVLRPMVIFLSIVSKNIQNVFQFSGLFPVFNFPYFPAEVLRGKKLRKGIHLSDGQFGEL